MTVKQMQCLLLYLGYDPGTVDGIDGAKTRAALAQFTSDYGTGAEGLVEAVCKAEPKKNFWDTVPNFSRLEFRCHCGACGGFPAEPEETLVRVLQRVRDHFSQPVTISSGVRCPAHNAKVGGVPDSLHLIGKAADFAVRGSSAATVLAYVQAQPEIVYAYAIDGSFVHMNVRR